VQFEVVHEFDIPLDAIELAVLSPDLAEKLLHRIPNVESITQKSHDLGDKSLKRVWSFQANVKIPRFARPYITKEMCAWDEETSYDLRAHSSTWTITPKIKPEWQKYFSATGKCELFALDSGRTKRVLSGDVNLKVKLVKAVAEKLIVAELKKTFDAEAETLRELAQLT
jgi:hypothetical protein